MFVSDHALGDKVTKACTLSNVVFWQTIPAYMYVDQELKLHLVRGVLESVGTVAASGPKNQHLTGFFYFLLR
jgi:hypothetical protein